MLDTIFYELWNEGYIYEEDENGENMSYGEYIAIDQYFQDFIREKIEECYDFKEAVEFIENEVKCCGDDVRIFTNLDEFDDFYIDVDEYENKITAYNVPEILQDKLEEYLYYNCYELAA